MNFKALPTRRGFTMVEILVVIIVIGILAAILLPALSKAITSARVAVIATEISQLESAIENYKTQNAGEYPPDCSNVNRIEAHLKRVYPRKTITVASNWSTLQRPDSTQIGGSNPTFGSLDPAESLVYWLSLIYANPADPLTNSSNANGTVKPPLFDFDVKRLKDQDGDGWPEYYPKYGGEIPYVYFNGLTYGTPNGSSVSYVTSSGGTGMARPYLETSNSPLKFAREGKFQIICGGLDGHYGEDNGQADKVFPNQSSNVQMKNVSKDDRDNLTNFGEGRTLENNQP